MVPLLTTINHAESDRDTRKGDPLPGHGGQAPFGQRARAGGRAWIIWINLAGWITTFFSDLDSQLLTIDYGNLPSGTLYMESIWK